VQVFVDFAVFVGQFKNVRLKSHFACLHMLGPKIRA
jgi:hypothetical protein